MVEMSTRCGPGRYNPGMDQGARATDPAGATRWLDPGEQRTWRAFMLSHLLLFEQFERDLQRDAGLPMAYYEILVRLSEAPEHRLRMSELAERSQSSRSRLSHAVARLEESGWVRRESCPTDRRGAVAVLTGEGYAALEAAAPAHVESVRTHLFDPLSPTQLEALRDISETILGHLAASGVVCASAVELPPATPDPVPAAP
jgi:DNA-binding MarR family transcriptional regulator